MESRTFSCLPQLTSFIHCLLTNTQTSYHSQRFSPYLTDFLPHPLPSSLPLSLPPLPTRSLHLGNSLPYSLHTPFLTSPSLSLPYNPTIPTLLIPTSLIPSLPLSTSPYLTVSPSLPQSPVIPTLLIPTSLIPSLPPSISPCFTVSPVLPRSPTIPTLLIPISLIPSLPPSISPYLTALPSLPQSPTSESLHPYLTHSYLTDSLPTSFDLSLPHSPAIPTSLVPSLPPSISLCLTNYSLVPYPPASHPHSPTHSLPDLLTPSLCFSLTHSLRSLFPSRPLHAQAADIPCTRGQQF